MTDPLIVSVKEAKRLLALGNNKFWKLASAGEFGPLLGTPRKRFLTTDSIRAYVARQVAAAKAAPRSERGMLPPNLRGKHAAPVPTGGHAT